MSSDSDPAGTSDRSDETENSPGGFFSRLFTAFTPAGEVEPESGAAEGASGETGLGVLSRLRVDDVAIPAAEIQAVPMKITKDDLVEAFRLHGYSRLPVYKGNLDHPLGLVHLKDLALTHGFGASGRFSLKKMLRPILFAPPSMPAGVLLQKMQKDRVHMALVIDEYGGVDGLVTIEDLIETVIGEIEDEHDEQEGPLWQMEAPGLVLAQSIAPLDELEESLGLKLATDEDDEEIDTIGGLVFLRTGRVPARGEVVTLENGVEIEIVDADARRIKRLRLHLPGKGQAGTLSAAPVPEADQAG